MNEKNGEASKAGARFRARMVVNPSANDEAGPSSNRKVRTIPRESRLLASRAKMFPPLDSSWLLLV